MWFQIGLPKPMTILSLTLDTRGSNDDYPRSYQVTVSDDGKKWGKPVAEGHGSGPVVKIEFDSAITARHVRITQTGSSRGKYWSIHELAIQGIPAGTIIEPKTLERELLKASIVALAREARAKGNPKRGATIFYNDALSCMKCHDPDSGPRLGPDLAAWRDGVTDNYLVESILNPSKTLRKGFEPIVVRTHDGSIRTGLRLRQDSKALVLLDPAGGGKEVTIPSKDIDRIKQGSISAMPPGLVNQLADRAQFLDLVRFLMEIHEGGATRLKELRK